MGFGKNDETELVSVFKKVCSVSYNDGVVFDAESVSVARICEELEYGGLRITAKATVDGARVPVVIDVAFGDSVEPGLQEIEMSFFRVMDLAEVIYNLQSVPGFDECLTRMRDGDIEGTYASLILVGCSI